MSFFTATISSVSQSPPIQFRQFVVLRHTTEWDESDSSGIGANYRLVHGRRNDAYVYNQEAILCCSGIIECVLYILLTR